MRGGNGGGWWVGGVWRLEKIRQFGGLVAVSMNTFLFLADTVQDATVAVEQTDIIDGVIDGVSTVAGLLPPPWNFVVGGIAGIAAGVWGWRKVRQNKNVPADKTK